MRVFSFQAPLGATWSQASLLMEGQNRSPKYAAPSAACRRFVGRASYKHGAPLELGPLGNLIVRAQCLPRFTFSEVFVGLTGKKTFTKLSQLSCNTYEPSRHDPKTFFKIF